LEARGISDESADRCGLRSVDPRAHADAVGQDRLRSEGIHGGLIPFFGLDGQKIDFCRSRVFGVDFTPPRAKKPAKYLQPPGTRSRLYFPPVLGDGVTWLEVARDARVSLLLTEGEFKAIKACQEGRFCIGLTGVWNFLSKGEDAGTESNIVDDLTLLAWSGRTVHIVFDSDAATNPSVLKAEHRLMQELYKLGARPYSVRLPSWPGVGKVGLDDFLAKRGRRADQELAELIAAAVSPFVPTVRGTAELAKMRLRAPEFVIHDLLPKGATMLAALPKIGKSFFALQAGHAIASGAAFSSYVVRKGRVLYLALEDSPYRIRSRLTLMGLVPTDDLQIANEWPRGEDGYRALKRYLEENPTTVAVFIDTWQRIRQPSGRNDNIYQADYVEIAAIKALADQFEIAILLIHHLKKGAVDDVFQGVLGSTGITGALDTILVLHRSRAESSATLHVTGRDIPEQQLALEHSQKECTWKVLGPVARVHLSAQRTAILEALKAAKRPMQLNEIAKETSTSVQNARKMLVGLIGSELVAQDTRGEYRAIEDSRGRGDV
jgi:hypothetical protein